MFRFTGFQWSRAWRAAAWRVWLPLAALAFVTQVHAQTDPLTTGWAATGCSNSGCHATPVNTSSASIYSAILTMNLLGGSRANFITQSRTWCNAGQPGNGTTMCTSFSSYFTVGTTDDTAMGKVYDYLVAARNTTNSGSPAAFPKTTPGSTSGTTRTVTLNNYRSTPVSFTATPSTHFAVQGNSCGGSIPAAVATAGATLGDPGQCTVTLQFSPVAGTSFASITVNGTLSLAFTDPQVVQNPSATSVALSGEVNLPPTISVAASPAGPLATPTSVTYTATASDPNPSDTVALSWSLVRPALSAATLSGSGSTRTLTTDRAGDYTVTVQASDGATGTVSASRTVTQSNTTPVATPGSSTLSTSAPTTVTLLGSGTDPNGDTITAFTWSVVQQPSGSSISLQPSTSVQSPTFAAVKSGLYRLALRVSDGVTLSPVATVDVTLNNSPPIASAGAPRSITAPATVTMTTATASDPNNDALTYAWTFKTVGGKPSDSAATISGATSLNGASFVADKSGTYVLTLTVTDTVGGGTATSDITITAANTPPDSVSAGPARSVTVNQPITLAGAANDANGDTMSFSWNVARPGGGTVTLTNATTLNPGFTPDVTGAWAVTLTANDNHGGITTSPATTITVLNAAVAIAGSSQLVTTGSTVTLDGSGSTTSTGGALTYAWTLPTRPAGSAAVLTGASSVSPGFVADVSGSYVAALQVTDSLGTSPISTVTITADRPPVANAGTAQAAITGTLVTLDGSASSDADGDALTYSWTLPTRPAGSAAALVGPTGARPTLTPDVPGNYVASLVVNDGRLGSAAATVTITVSPPPPQFSISSNSFAATAQLTLATTVSAIVSNGGGQDLTLGTLTFSGAAFSDFTLASGNTCTSGLSIAPAGSCTLTVRFAPSALGSRVASLAITHNAAGSSATIALNGTGTPAPQGRIAIGATSLTFLTTFVTGSSTQSVTVQNSGDLALNFSAFTVGGTNLTEFIPGGTCAVGTPLGIGAQCTVVVTFQPTAAGSRTASLTITSDASNGPATIALAGPAVPLPAPIVTFSTQRLDFGTQTIGGLYPPRSITLTNTGNADLTSVAISVQGTGFSDVSTAACPATLTSGSSCTIDVRFAPTAASAFAGTLRVTSNATGVSPVDLVGSGTVTVVPVLVWSPAVTRLDFGQVDVGTISATQSATVLNQGPGGVTLALFNAIGPDGTAFSVSGGTCAVGQVLFEGQSCRLDFRFAPGAPGARAATVQLASSGSAPADLVLAGTGLGGPTPALSVSATDLPFGGVRTGARSLPQELTISASGSGGIVISSIAITGPFTVQSKTCPTPPFALAVGSDCVLLVSFQPQGEGAASGKLSITSDASPTPRDVALSGTGDAETEVSTGGCSIASGDRAADPTLWALLLGALISLIYRRSVRLRAAQRDSRGMHA